MTSQVQPAKLGLGGGKSPLGRFAKPLRRFGVVPLYASAIVVTDAEAVLGVGVTLYCRLAKPLHRFGVVAAMVGGFTLIELGWRVGRSGLP